ncbi:MAG: hypothetical protein RBR12_04840 [Sulfurospirillum cavolei]|nr:hypothetical protein [Sulfurospirillum cavolei]
MKRFFFVLACTTALFAHPVSYTINLKVAYDDARQSVTVECESDSRNKCGLHDLRLINAHGDVLTTASFPFMKESTSVSCPSKPAKMIFYLRQIPEHTYEIIFD